MKRSEVQVYPERSEDVPQTSEVRKYRRPYSLPEPAWQHISVCLCSRNCPRTFFCRIAGAILKV
jgi:hypothetical protein